MDTVNTCLNKHACDPVEKMSVTDEFDQAPVDVPNVEVKLFGRWSMDDVHVNDISLSVCMYVCVCVGG